MFVGRNIQTPDNKNIPLHTPESWASMRSGAVEKQAFILKREVIKVIEAKKGLRSF